MILLNTKNYLIGDSSMCADSDRTFNIRLNDLATYKELLDGLNLISMYCSKDNAYLWFKTYLGAFNGTKEARDYLNDNPLLKILLLDKEVEENVLKLIERKWGM